MKHPTKLYKGLGSGWCPVPYCKEGAKWWTCSKCGEVACGNHQIFNGRIVTSCWFCNLEVWARCH